MEPRKLLVGGLLALIGVTALTVVVAIVALQATTANAERTARQLDADLELAQEVRVQVERLAHDRLGDAASDLLPLVERLAMRALQLRARDAWRLQADLSEFIRNPNVGRDIIDTHLDAFLVARQHAFEESLHDGNVVALRGQVVLLAIGLLGGTIALVIYVVVLRNLTRQLRRVRDATKAANQIAAARRETMDIVAHDLRVPLNTIALSATLLEDGKARDLTERSHIERIGKAAERMEHLIDDLADAEDMESGRIALHYERCDTRSIVVACLDMFTARAKARDVRIRTDAQVILPVRADRERLLQVLSNLINNALRFTSPQGMITLGVSPGRRGVRFSVSDTGPGIPLEDHAHLFDRHWQGRDPRGDGSGLGLYICKRLVEAHDGHIGVESQVGMGSTFWFVIPD